MPYVNESSSDPYRMITVGREGGTLWATSFLDGRHRSQYGYRSKQLTQEEVDSIESGTSNSATMLSHIRLLEETSGSLSEIGYRRHDMRYWPTNRRDYRETAYGPTGFTAQLDIRPHPHKVPNKVTLRGAHGIESTTLVLPTDPEESYARSIAGQLLRDSRPPVERFNLARSIAEQKDAPMLLKLSNYIPRSPKDLGGAVLNFLFGLKPTGEDIGKALALALKTDAAVRSLLESENIQERRYNTRTLLNESDGGSLIANVDSCKGVGAVFNVGPFKVKGAFLTCYSAAGSPGDIMDSLFHWQYTKSQSIRTHATWEYFVPRPLGLEERLPGYRLAAENLLQTFKFDASVVYDLTPWTWLGNWFADIGGLLRYQEAVLDNQQVMSNSGYTVTTQVSGSVTYVEQRPNANYGVGYNYEMYNLSHPMSTSTYMKKHVVREPCSPYSVGPSWDLSGQQWSILGALGLARSPGVPNIR